MKKRIWAVLPIMYAALLSCASMGGGESGDFLSLEEAIERSVMKLRAELPAGTRVAVVAFDSEDENLSGYIMDELAAALAGGDFEVADRRNLPLVYQELNFQMSGDVSDETASSVGKFLAAEYVLTGQLIKAGGRYRYSFSGINVETVVLEISLRLDVRKNRAMSRLIADLRRANGRSPAADKPPASAPGTAGAFLDRGILFATRRDFELAIMDFTEAIRLDDTLAAAYLLRGRAYAAGASYVTGISENFSGFGFISTGGKNITAEQEAAFTSAIADYTRAIQLDPNLAAAYRERGRTYGEIGDHDTAVEDLNQAIRLNPDSVAAYNIRGLAYANKGDYDRAIADYTQAINLDPKDAAAYYNRGNAYDDKGDYDRAIKDYNRAINLDPKAAMTYNNRGNAYQNKGDYDQAIADCTQAINLDPNFAWAYHNRGLAYHNKRDYDQAIEDYTQAINLDPKYAAAYHNRGLAYANKGDYDRAIEDYNRAINFDPKAALTYHNRGLAYENKGDYKSARADYEQALRIDPNHTDARNNLERLRKMRY
jgi:tetratricopeptide (TPR) repeat protein